MKGFKNILAAGALGVILAATGCQNYQMPVTDPSSPLYNAGTTETTTRATRGTRGFVMPGYSNRYAANTKRNINATRSAGQVAKRNITSRTTNRTTRNATRTLPSGNTYQANRATGAARNTVTALNKDNSTFNRGSYGRQNQYAPTRTNTRYGTNTGASYTRNTRNTINTRNTYNTGNVTQFPAANRTNRTGSPFGDYNKDRAYSLTRGTDVTGSNINAASRINNVADNAAHTANTTRGTVVRKGFTQGKEITHTADDSSVIKSGTANKTTRSNTANQAKLTKTQKADSKKTRAAATTGKAVNNTAKNTATTAKKANQANTAGTTRQATVNNTAKVNNTAVNNTAVNNVGSVINRNTGAQSFNKPVNRINGARSASIKRVVETEAYNEIDDAHLPPKRISGVNVKRQNPNAVTTRTRTNNTARTNNMNNRKRFTTTNRGIGNYSYTDNNTLRPYGYYDNLTFDNTYRNADLRNNFYAPDMLYGYYGAGNYGTPDLASGTRSGVTRSANTGTYGSYDSYSRYGGYPSYYFSSFGGHPSAYYHGGNNPYYGSYTVAGGTTTGTTRNNSSIR